VIATGVALDDTEDPFSGAQLSEMQSIAPTSAIFLAELNWSKRVATRKYRADKGKFGPRSKFGPQKIAKRFTRPVPSNHRGASLLANTLSVFITFQSRTLWLSFRAGLQVPWQSEAQEASIKLALIVVIMGTSQPYA